MGKTRRLAAVLVIALWLAPGQARADLQVYPTRILLDDRQHHGVVNLRHIGPKVTRYRITPVFYDVKDDGQMVRVEAPTLKVQHFAGELVRFSPRVVTLEPNVAQTIRVMTRLSDDLPTGEYRMHLLFETFEEGDAEVFNLPAATADGINMALRAHRAVAIPVVVRHGKLDATVALSNASVAATADGHQQMTVTMTKTGDRSIHGDFVVRLGATSGDAREVGVLKGISLYRSPRVVSIPLKDEPFPAHGDGTLRVSFSDRDAGTDVTVDAVLAPARK